MPLLLRSLKSLGIINTESTQSPPLECVQSICFMENLTLVVGSDPLTILSPLGFTLDDFPRGLVDVSAVMNIPMVGI